MQPISSLAIAACTLAVVLGTTAEVRAARVTFVSPNGNNADPCTTPATPCADFSAAAGAMAKTDAGGVIHVAPGDYPAFSIDKAIEIIVNGGHASITGSGIGIPGGGALIVVNAGAADEVRIRGFVLDDAAFPGSHGVAFLTGGALHLEDCALVHAGGSFAGSYGVAFLPTAASELYVSNCVMSGSDAASAGGVLIRPSGSGSAKVVLDNVHVEGNTLGIQVIGNNTSGTNNITIRNSTIAGNGGAGLYVADAGGGTTSLSFEGSSSVNNGAQGAVAVGSTATVRMRNSTVTGNVEGIQAALGANFISHGGNVVAGNTFGNGAFTQTLPQQ